MTKAERLSGIVYTFLYICLSVGLIYFLFFSEAIITTKHLFKMNFSRDLAGLFYGTFLLGVYVVAISFGNLLELLFTEDSELDLKIKKIKKKYKDSRTRVNKKENLRKRRLEVERLRLEYKIKELEKCQK